MLPVCPQICHLLAIFLRCSLKGYCREGTYIKGSGFRISSYRTNEHILSYISLSLSIYKIYAGTGSRMMLLVLVINRYWARLPDGNGSKATLLQGSSDIINVLCVWQSNDPALIQLHVAYAVKTLPSNMVKELRSLLQSSSGCFCF